MDISNFSSWNVVNRDVRSQQRQPLPQTSCASDSLATLALDKFDTYLPTYLFMIHVFLRVFRGLAAMTDFA